MRMSITGGERKLPDKDYDLLRELEKKLEYSFIDYRYLQGALIHTSYANEHSKDNSRLNSNERIEFLGDSVLGLAVSVYIYRNYPDMPEGRMSKLRASVVCESTLAEIASKIGLDKCMKLGIGEEMTGGRNKPSILADAMESVFAAIYLDGGFESASRVIQNFIVPEIVKRADNLVLSDYKSRVQEILSRQHCRVVYEIIEESGPEHARTFTAKAFVEGGVSAVGCGRSKKDAEQHAARILLNLVEKE